MKFLETIGALSNTTERTLNPLRAFALCCKVNKNCLFLFRIKKKGNCILKIDLESSRCFI
jgi:hypothetical protein